ncbi:MAG: hypothetical protein ACKVP0_11465 [Pirellulaceae bacterium]
MSYENPSEVRSRIRPICSCGEVRMYRNLPKSAITAALLTVCLLQASMAADQTFPWGPFRIIEKSDEKNAALQIEQLIKSGFGVPSQARPESAAASPGSTPLPLPSKLEKNSPFSHLRLPRGHILRFERPDRFSLIDSLRKPLLEGSCKITKDELQLTCESGPLAGEESQRVAKYRWKFSFPEAEKVGENGGSAASKKRQAGDQPQLILVSLNDTHGDRVKLLSNPWGVPTFPTLLVGKWCSDETLRHTLYEFDYDGVVKQPKSSEELVATGKYELQASWVIVTAKNPFAIPAASQTQKSIWVDVQLTLGKLTYKQISVAREISGTTYPNLDDLKKLSTTPTQVLYRK